MIFHKRGKPETPSRRISQREMGACASGEPLMQPPRNGQLSRVMPSTSQSTQSTKSTRWSCIWSARAGSQVRGTCHRNRLHFESRCQVIMAAPFGVGAGIRSCMPKRVGGHALQAKKKKEKLGVRKTPSRQALTPPPRKAGGQVCYFS